MPSILETIAEHARRRVLAARAQVSIEALKALCRQGGAGQGRLFEQALRGPQMRFICEIKKASPSKGVIDPDFAYLSIAADYEAAGADCISCLTEPKWFLGSDAIFGEIRRAVSLPMLRKDFTVDEYQLYQARHMGANAVLLICAILDAVPLGRYLGICDELGLAALVEAHDAAEIACARAAGARIIGVNNRNLKDFSVDLSNAARLRDLVPPDVLFVAESGVRTPADIAALKGMGVDGVLIGEALMRAPDRREMLARLRGAA